MSTATALAAVTAVLRDLLLNGIIDRGAAGGVGPVTVSAVPPDKVPTTGDGVKSQLNLFLYAVSPNPGWRNVGLPSRSATGERLTNPPLALDLHYLLSAHGTGDFHAELLLGYAMQVLHETPVLTRGDIRRAFESALSMGGALPAFLQSLGESGLAEQVEQIKITPVALGTDELSKLWSACQTNFRTSATYHVSTVLIEGTRRTRESFPVRERRVHAAPLRAPVVDGVAPQVVEAGGMLVLSGRELLGEHLEVRFGAVVADPETVTASSTRVTVSPLPAALLAGVQTVRVSHGLLFGTPGDPHRGPESNLSAFVLAPRITSAPPLTVARGATLSLSVVPAVRYDQRVRLLAGETAVEIPARLAPPAGPETAASLSFPIPADFPAGTYPVRVEIDGAASALLPDPLTGEYALPALTVTA